MRRVMMAIGMMLAAVSGAQAKVAIVVDKDAQQMTVSVDGVPKYTWPVSSGIPSRETPNGQFQTFRMEENHFSKEFDDAPMPHAIFFTKMGHAIHGTDSVGRLGTPASHGCVRLSRENATTLWDLVKADGLLTTSVTLTGSAQVALARNPRPANRAVARRDTAPDYAMSPDADAGDPTSLSPLPEGRQIMPQQIAPRYADSGTGYQDDYAPRRAYRGSYDAQGARQQRYYVERGGYQQPQVYYAPQGYGAPRGYYQRGYGSDW